MRLFLSLCICLLPFLFVTAQDAASLLKEAERLEIAPDENAAFLKYKEVLKMQSTNMKALCKCSELCSRIGQRQTVAKTRDEYYKAAKIYAETALKIDATNSDANTAMAIAIGRTTLTKSGKEKVTTAKDIRKYVDVALKTNPTNFLALHVLGRWHYEISNLTVIEKAAVKLLYGGFPPSSLKEGIKAFEKAKTLAPGFALNYLELAKAYHRNKENKKAVALLNEMLLLANVTEDDVANKEIAKKYIKEWN
jgi:tetratricopeptide (TPR) repeat protein